uniref:IZH family channel protein n=1 Tax=Mycena chlorophos TaxID=658473 RepID=A0ABQ0LYK5_MYCCL|nr:IZH family channel protein [Mycena chlorophos]
MAPRARNRHRSSRSSNQPVVPVLPLAQHVGSSFFRITAASLLVRLAAVAGLASSKIRKAPQTRTRIPDADPAVEAALEKSHDGRCLIAFDDLPPAWQGDPLIRTGYRFIPLSRLSSLLLSAFTLHNEFLSIQIHIFFFVYSCWKWWRGSLGADLGEIIVLVAGLFCLAASVCGHLMTGCAHQHTMETCHRIDYVGIAWMLCSCNISLLYYGYAGHPHIAYPLILMAFLMAVAGSFLPFVPWFNQFEHRAWRIGFFVALKISAIAPAVGVCLLFGMAGLQDFLLPFARPVLGGAFGIFLYSTHYPERLLDPNGKWARRFNTIGFGSHALWHVVSAMSLLDWAASTAVVRERFINRV